MAHAEKREKKKMCNLESPSSVFLMLLQLLPHCLFIFLNFLSHFLFSKLISFFLELCALLPLLLTFNLTFEQLAVSHFPSLIHASHIYIYIYFFFFSIHISTCIQCIMKLLGHDTHIMGLNIVGMWA